MDLSNIQLSTHDGPTRVAVYSGEGVGKTWFATHFPRPVVIGGELGIPRDLPFRVPLVQPKTWIDVFGLVASLTNDAHDYETLIFDTVDWIEPLIHKFVLERDSTRKTEMNPKGHELLSIEDYGYGKGYLAAEEEFRKLIQVLDALQARRGMHVVLLMHAGVRTFENPTGPNFDRFEGKPHKRITRVVVEWAEHVFFLFFDMVAGKIPDDVARSEKGAKAKGMGSGQRMCGTRWSTAYDAKNRLGLEPELILEDPRELIDKLVAGSAPTTAQRTPTPAARSSAPAPARETARETAPAPARETERQREPEREPEPKTRGPEPERAPATRDVAPSSAPAKGAIDPAIAAAATSVIDRAKRLGGEPMRKQIADWCKLANEQGVQVVERINKLHEFLDTRYPQSGNTSQEQRA